MKIFDCFQLFNELDILEIRLDYLYEYVDYFVISESNQTHAGTSKPLYFEENKHLFEKYLDKIIHIKKEYPVEILNMGRLSNYDKESTLYNKISEIYDLEENEGQLKSYPTFCRDYLQREFCKFGLLECKDEDVILISDLDEIPTAEGLIYIRHNNFSKLTFMQGCYYYYINTLAHTNWYGTCAVKYHETKDVSLSHIRRERANYEKIVSGGWHFSFVGGLERVKTKIISYAHQEFNNPSVLDKIEERINNSSDPFGRSNHTYINSEQEFFYSMMPKISLTKYPTKMIDLIKNKYNYLIKY